MSHARVFFVMALLLGSLESLSLHRLRPKRARQAVAMSSLDKPYSTMRQYTLSDLTFDR